MQRSSRTHASRLETGTAERRGCPASAETSEARGSRTSYLRNNGRRIPEREPDDDEPRQPRPSVIVPDVALQLVGPPCPDDGEREQLVSSLRQLVAPFAPNADVRIACPGDTDADRLTIAIWENQSPTQAERRQAAIEALRLATNEPQWTNGPHDTFRSFVKASFLNRVAQAEFAKHRRFDAELREDPEGPIHLERLSLEFRSPNRVVSRIEGFDDRPWPDVDFTLTVTDTLSVDGSGGLVCDTASETDVDDADVAAAVLLGGLATAGTLFGSVLLLPVALYAWINDLSAAFGGGTEDGQDEGGAGCLAARVLGRSRFPQANRAALDVAYFAVNVDAGGIEFLGEWVPAERQPRLVLSGPAGIEIDERDSSVIATYHVRAEDALEPVSLQWTSNGQVLDQGGPTTRIRFARPEVASGESVDRFVRVAGTEADGTPLDPVRRDVRLTVLDAHDALCRANPRAPGCPGDRNRRRVDP